MSDLLEECFKSLTTLGSSGQDILQEIKMLEFWNKAKVDFFMASSKLWDSKNLLNFLSVWYFRLLSMPDGQNEMPKITLSETLPGFTTSTPTTKNILSHFNIILCKYFKLNIHFSQFCQQNRLFTTYLKYHWTRTVIIIHIIATNPQNWYSHHWVPSVCLHHATLCSIFPLLIITQKVGFILILKMRKHPERSSIFSEVTKLKLVRKRNMNLRSYVPCFLNHILVP